MFGWSKEKYEAKQAERARKLYEAGKKPIWWLGQTDPVARFTAYLAVFTFLLIVVSTLQWVEIKRGGVDTHILAEATDKLAEAAKYQAESAAGQASIMQGQLNVMKAQLDDVKEATARIKRPHFFVGDFHIWDEGKGSLLNPNDAPPTWKKGMKIEGAVIATNNGYATTNITGYCLAYWATGPLPMVNPGTGADPTNQMWEGFDQREAGNPINAPPYNHEIRPGTSARCPVKTTVSDGDLYLIGHIAYLDDIKKLHNTLFAQKYIPSERRFEAVKNSTYERED